jgi:uncharacterized damage-inducible protein DinB
MSEEKVRDLILEQDLTPKIALLYAQMQAARAELVETVENLTIQEIDFTPDTKKIESIGTLLLHIGGVEWSWIFEDIKGMEIDFEKWKHGFPLRKEINIPQITSKDTEFYLKQLEEVRTEVYNFLLTLKDKDLEKKVIIEKRTFTIKWILYHLIEHEIWHLGQIKLLIRLQKL